MAEANIKKNPASTTGDIIDTHFTVGTRKAGSVIGANSTAFGQNNVASGEASHAEGIGTTTDAHACHAEGYGTKASWEGAHAEGKNTQAIEHATHAEGENTIANKAFAHAEGNGTKASGWASHAEGENTQAQSNDTHAEGFGTRAASRCAHSEGDGTEAIGECSHAEGYYTKAMMKCSHAEGDYTEAGGEYSHAEGSRAVAAGRYAHAEGQGTMASGECSHAEGKETRATEYSTHAEGEATYATKQYAHAEGYETEAEGIATHAEGYGTCAHAYASHAQGLFNKVTSGSQTAYSATSTAFAIGNGQSDTRRSNAFRVDFDGGVYAKATYHSNGADYAEYFEWLDGNSGREDRVGFFVALDGEKIRKATAEDTDILGIVSITPSVVGDAQEDVWKGMYLTDKWGRAEYEYVETPLKNTDGGVRRDYVLKVNPEYQAERAYIPRSKRPEWDAVGMMGKLMVRDDGTCQVNGYCTSNEEGIATASDAKNGYRVLKRIDSETICVLMK